MLALIVFNTTVSLVEFAVALRHVAGQLRDSVYRASFTPQLTLGAHEYKIKGNKATKPILRRRTALTCFRARLESFRYSGNPTETS